MTLLRVASFGQEFPLDAFPEQMRQPIGESAIYRLFFRHVAAFEREARLSQSRGTSGEAFRHHLKNRFGIDSNEYFRIAETALAFDDQFANLRSRQRTIAVEFRREALSDARLLAADLLPTVPPELLVLSNEIEGLTIRSRNQIQTALGAARFLDLESRLRNRDLFHLSFPQIGGNRPQSTAGGGFTYGYASIDVDPATKQVTAYAETDMDGTLLPYYEPEVGVTRITGLDSLSGARGPDKEYVSSCRTTQSDTAICKFTGTSALYEIFAEHSLRLMVPDSTGNQWIDYANYGDVASLDILDRFEVPFFGPGPPQSISDQSVSIGQTWVATWWK